jgi:hypothetical protein
MTLTDNGMGKTNVKASLIAAWIVERVVSKSHGAMHVRDSKKSWRCILKLKLLQGDLEPVYRAALALGTANQLTNILRDVGEDIRERNRIYLPLDEMAKYGIVEDDLISGMHCSSTGAMDDRYVRFTRYMVRTCFLSL